MEWYFVLLIAFGGVAAGALAFWGIQAYLVARWNRKHRSLSGHDSLRKKYQMLNLETEQEGCQMLFLGDSITDYYPVHEFFPGRAYVNRGISGDVTAGVLERLEDNVFGLRPKKILLLIGVNDINNIAKTPKYVFDNIVKIVERTHEALPQTEVILSAVYPVNNNLYKRGVVMNSNAKIAELNKMLSVYARKNNMRFNRTAEALTDAEGYFSTKYTDDGLHPNLSGYRAITKYLNANKFTR